MFDRPGPSRGQENYTGDCDCGGTLGWKYLRESGDTRYFHYEPGSSNLISWVQDDSYLFRRGRTRETQLMILVEGQHKRAAEEARRAEEERMNIPENWPHFKGKTILVTGSLERYDRTGAQRAIAKAGGFPCDRMTTDVDLFVFGNRPGPLKVKFARENRIPTIKEGPFYALLQRSEQFVNASTDQRPRPPIVIGPPATARGNVSGSAVRRFETSDTTQWRVEPFPEGVLPVGADVPRVERTVRSKKLSPATPPETRPSLADILARERREREERE